MLSATTSAGPGADSLLGAELGGRYRLIRRLATGGMGTIYRGEHLELGRPVAVKVLSPEYALNEEAVKRFLREARASSKLDHPHIVDILDLGRLDTGEPYLVMELLEGEDAADAIAREAPMPIARVCEILAPIANALDAVHAQGVLHRDVKPANIFLARGQDGVLRPKLLDFGLAALRETPGDDKLTREGIVVGTPHYVSPEAAEGEPIDARTDVYSLGVVIFEMLTGQLPIDADSPMALLYAKVRKPAPTLSQRTGETFPPALERLVARTLSRTPKKRPASARELVGALAELLEAPADGGGGEPAAAASSARAMRSAAPAVRPSEPVRLPTDPRRRLVIGAVIAVVVALVTIALWPLDDGAPTSAELDREALTAGETVPPALTAPARATPSAPDGTAPEIVEAPPPAPRARPRPVATASAPAPAAEPDRQAGPEREAPSEERDPERARALSRQAATALLRGEFARARMLYRRATFADDALAEAWRGLGLASERLDMVPEAIAAYRRYLELAGSAPDAARVRGRVAALSR